METGQLSDCGPGLAPGLGGGLAESGAAFRLWPGLSLAGRLALRPRRCAGRAGRRRIRPSARRSRPGASPAGRVRRRPLRGSSPHNVSRRRALRPHDRGADATRPLYQARSGENAATSAARMRSVRVVNSCGINERIPRSEPCPFAEDYMRDYRVKFVDVRVNPPGGRRKAGAYVQRCEHKGCDELGLCKAPKPFAARTIQVPGQKVADRGQSLVLPAPRRRIQREPTISSTA